MRLWHVVELSPEGPSGSVSADLSEPGLGRLYEKGSETMNK